MGGIDPEADPNSGGTHGGRRAGSGRHAHPLGKGVKTCVMIPSRLHAAIRAEAESEGVTFSCALVNRLIRGGRLREG